MITVTDIIDAIAARHIPLHMAVELSQPDALEHLWSSERNAARLCEFLDWMGIPISITLAFEAAAMAIDHAHADYIAASFYLASAQRLLESQGLPESQIRDIASRVEMDRLRAGERLELARIEVTAQRVDSIEGRDARATRSAWHAVVMALRALQTQRRGVDARNQIGESIGSADNAFFESDAPMAIPDLIRRDFGPPTLEQIIMTCAPAA